MSAPRVFISYAQHAPQHSARVLGLAEALRQQGVDANLDQFHRHELLDWPRWCQEQLQPARSDWVLMVCSKAYRDRIEDRVDPHTGKGAFWEGTLIDDQLYQAKGNRRFVPVLLDDESEDSIPTMVRGWTWFRVHGLDFTDPGFTDLYRLLTGQPAVAMRPLGRRADLGPDRAAPEEPSPSPGPADPERPRHPPIQSRAVRLLQVFFANDDERTRRTIVNLAFGDCERDPRPAIQYTDSALIFADHLVDILLKHGCTGRGRHSLSLLIETMGNLRGRQTDPNYFELPPLLDDLCALPTRDEELSYLQRLLDEIEEKARLYAPLRGIADIKSAAQAAALLAPWEDDEDIALLMHRPRRRAGAEGAEQREYEDILAAFGDVKQAALLGAPGAGKSTTLRRLAADLARAALADPMAALPILVSLGDWRGDEGLPEFLTARIPEIGWAVQALGKEARLVLLLDGLNELPTAKRGAKAAEVLALKDRLTKGTPCIISCRRDDYVGDLDLGLDTLSLEPLSPQRIRQVLRHWLPDDAESVQQGSAERLFWRLAGDERLADVLATWLEAGSTEDAFWSVADPQEDEKAHAKTSDEENEIWRRNVPNPRSLLRLAANPFMLTMLYQVWAFEGELPRNRGDLFARFVDRLLSREGLIRKDTDTGGWQRDARVIRLIENLANVATSMQLAKRIWKYGGVDLTENYGVLTVIPKSDAVRIVGGESMLKIAEDATLLEAADPIGVRFRHQLIQEYFTAIAMRKLLAGGSVEPCRLWPAERWWERSGWEESAVLLAGLFSKDCTPVVRWLKDAQPEVAVQCIVESGAEIDDREALLRELHDAWLPRLTDLNREPAPEARAAIGRALGRLEIDDRQGIGITPDGLPDIDWVDIGVGEAPRQDAKLNRSQFFRISRYLITFAQFQAFIDADDGYEDDRWWAGFDDPRRGSGRARWPISNHPRETVSWFEAMAFCAWLDHRLGVEGQNLTIRLPTVSEWECGVRGADGRVYPWGHRYLAGHANVDETGGYEGRHNLGQTTAVGIYPCGASPEGILDLAGNVWEWCLREQDIPELGRSDTKYRAARGGSWRTYQDRALASYRGSGDPAYRGDDTGFRVVHAPPIR